MPAFHANTIGRGIVLRTPNAAGTEGQSMVLAADGKTLEFATVGASSPLTLTANNSTETPLTIEAAVGQTATLTAWENAAGAVGARINAAAEFVNPGSGAASGLLLGDDVGRNLTSSAANNTFVGRSIAQNATILNSNVIIGSGLAGSIATSACNSNVGIGLNVLFQTTSGSHNIAVGNQAGYRISSGTNNILLGRNVGLTGNSPNTGSDNILLGQEAQLAANGSNATAIGRETVGYPNWFVAGSTSYPMGDVAFGKGRFSASPAAWALHGTSGSGTDIAGGGLSLAAGQGTGAGNGGDVKLQVALPGASGSSLNALADKLTVRGSDGLIVLDVPTSDPAVAGALWSDAGTLKVSAG